MGNENGKVWEEWAVRGGAVFGTGVVSFETHSYPYYLIPKRVIPVILEGTLAQGPGVIRAYENPAPTSLIMGA